MSRKGKTNVAKDEKTMVEFVDIKTLWPQYVTGPLYVRSGGSWVLGNAVLSSKLLVHASAGGQKNVRVQDVMCIRLVHFTVFCDHFIFELQIPRSRKKMTLDVQRQNVSESVYFKALSMKQMFDWVDALEDVRDGDPLLETLRIVHEAADASAPEVLHISGNVVHRVSSSISTPGGEVRAARSLTPPVKDAQKRRESVDDKN